jgi:hypothetical protein
MTSPSALAQKGVHMENPLKELLNQLGENAKKAPGWLPLLILCYIGIYVLPEGTTIIGLTLKNHPELVVTGVTLGLYILGDAFDKPVFKRLEPKRLDGCRLEVKKSLLLKDSIYRVSKSLAVAAKEYEQSWIRVRNESSKFFRSLVIPSVGAGIILLLKGRLFLGVAALVAAVIFLFSYVWLKASHMSALYKLSVNFVNKDEYEAYNPTEKARLFFWNGELVASGKPNRRDSQNNS